MTFEQFLQIIIGCFFALIGFGVKFVLSKLDEGFKKMGEIEAEQARQKQLQEDMKGWVKRVDSKLDLLVEDKIKNQ